MHIGCTVPFSHLTPVDYIGEAARHLEAAGFHSLWAPEHVLFFPEYASRYPYSATGRVHGDPEGVLDPFVALTFVAAHTSTLRLGTGVCLVPQRQPVYTAKAVADLDYLSRGRVDFDRVHHADALAFDLQAQAEAPTLGAIAHVCPLHRQGKFPPSAHDALRVGGRPSRDAQAGFRRSRPLVYGARLALQGSRTKAARHG